jgi:hypothetical protein
MQYGGWEKRPSILTTAASPLQRTSEAEPIPIKYWHLEAQYPKALCAKGLPVRRIRIRLINGNNMFTTYPTSS